MGIQPEIKEEKEGEGEKERESERERERERDGGNQSSDCLCPLLFRRPFILLIKHGDQWVTQSYAALAVQTLTKTRLFSLYT